MRKAYFRRLLEAGNDLACSTVNQQYMSGNLVIKALRSTDSVFMDWAST